MVVIYYIVQTKSNDSIGIKPANFTSYIIHDPLKNVRNIAY